ncbi:MAG: murein biosynthesis integral membrane protein MurJ [Candidatus Paceibacterota bacterium]|jgi:putative peptidoglycan lipid II flippase|nr:murein biosynthesis integral membrane protein MurJ [Candidatus Paceibacterota bacterium]
MVRRFLKLFQRDFSGLHEAAYLLGAFALLSQILGLVRDRLLAHSFGASHLLDMYYASFRIPDLLFVSVASFASATAIVPFFIERVNKGHDEAKKFLNDIFTLFFAAMAVASLIAFILMPTLAPYIVPGFSSADQSQVVFLARVLLLSPFLLGLSNLVGSITQSVNKFFVFALSPVLYNLGIILGIVFLYPMFGILGMILGVVIGAFFHLAIQLPVILKEDFFPKFSASVDWKSVRKVALLSLPRTLAMSINNISVLLLITFASLISVGSISIFQFSYNLQSVPLSIIGVSYSVAAFPTMARLFSNGEKKKFADHITNAAKHIIFWSLPVIFLFIVLRAQIVRVILGSGRFNWDDTRLTAASLAIFTVSLVAQSLILLFTRGYYAAGNTKKPLAINFFSSVLIVILAYYFIYGFSELDGLRVFLESTLKISGIAGAGVILLPLAYSIGTVINAALQWIAFEREFVPGMTKNISQAFWHSLSASFAMGIVAYEGLNLFALIFDQNKFWGVFFQGFLAGILGIFAGIIVLILLKNPEFKTVSTAMHHKFWKATTVSPGQEEI